MSGNKRELEDASESESKRIAGQEDRTQKTTCITNHQRRQELIDKLQSCRPTYKYARYDQSSGKYFIEEEEPDFDLDRCKRYIKILKKLHKLDDNDEEYKPKSKAKKEEGTYIVCDNAVLTFTASGTPEINEVFNVWRR